MGSDNSISLISITRNDIDGIDRTLRSTRKLRAIAVDRNLELQQIVIDGSDPDMAERVRKLVSLELGVRYHYEATPGISRAFNVGIEKSESEWIWLLNGGDELLEDAPIDMLLTLVARSGSDILIFSGSRAGQRCHTRPFAKLWPPVYCWIIHNATLIRRSVMTEFGGYKEDYKIAMDAELWIRVFGYYKQADVIDIPLINFQGGGISDDVLGRAPECLKMLWDNKRLLYSRMFDYPKICWEAWRSYRRNEKALRQRTRSR